MFSGVHHRSSNPPPAAVGRRISDCCTAIWSGRRLATTRSIEARRVLTPLAAGSSGLSGKTSNNPRPRMASRSVIVARRYASLTATIVNRGGRSTRNGAGDAWKSASKSGSLGGKGGGRAIFRTGPGARDPCRPDSRPSERECTQHPSGPPATTRFSPSRQSHLGERRRWRGEHR